MTKNVQSLCTRDGCRLAYEITGEGLPLVLIHGWTFDRNIWSSQVFEFSQHYKTIIYDRRGYGESDGKLDLRKDLDDLTDLLDHLAIDSACIHGMSQGGRVALRYAITQPAKVKALILQCAALDGYVVPKAYEGGQIPLAHYSTLAKQGDIEAVRDGWMNHQLMKIPTSRSSLKKQVKKIVDRYSGDDLAENITESMAFPINIAENLQKITIPTLIIEGTEETAMTIDVANKLHEEIQGSKKTVITGNGHLINLIEPEKYNQAVIDFLQLLIRI